MKKESGLSMVEIIVAIIILLLIAFFTIYSAQDSVPKAKATELYSEMKSVQSAIESVKIEIDMRENFTLEQDKHYDELGPKDGMYIIYGSLNHADCKAADWLGISNLKRDYIVNYDTGDFLLQEPVDIQGNRVTTLREVDTLINGGIR